MITYEKYNLQVHIQILSFIIRLNALDYTNLEVKIYVV